MTEKNILMQRKKSDGTFDIYYPIPANMYATASGTNTYTVSISGISSLAEGLSVKVKFTNANTGTATLNVNSLGAKSIVKSNGNALSSGNIKAGQICHLVYTGSNFQLLGEGGEYGTAQAGDVLSGKTIGTEEGIITGTMPNRGAISNTITTQNGQIAIPQGYHNGSGIVKAQFANLLPQYIKDGINIGGIIGSYSCDFVLANLPDKELYVEGNTRNSVTVPFTGVPSTGHIIAVTTDCLVAHGILNSTIVKLLSTPSASVTFRSSEQNDDHGTTYTEVTVYCDHYILEGKNSSDYDNYFSVSHLQALFLVE